ncbi:MAG: hypothetical protein ACE361_05975 [Aureliella sp.]
MTSYSGAKDRTNEPESNWEWLQTRVESAANSEDFQEWMSDELDRLEEAFADLITAKSLARSACKDEAGNRE